MAHDASLGSSTGRPWVAWLLACTVLPALPTALFGMFFVHPIPGILGRGRMDATPWLLVLAMLCQFGSSLWLGRAMSKKGGKGSRFVIVATFLLMVGSLVLGSVAAFAGCLVADDAYRVQLQKESRLQEEKDRAESLKQPPAKPRAVKQLTPAETAALMRLRAAAEQGDVEAQWKLGRNYRLGIQAPVDATEALYWLHKADDQNHAVAQWQLGCLYASGGNGVPQDKAEAARWFRKATEQHHLGALNMLGRMHRYGDGIPKDEAEAVRWFQQAADLGYYASQLNLGEMYVEGRGVPKDLVQASAWLQIAAEQGSKDAVPALQRIEQAMTPEQIQLAARRADELRAKFKKSQAR